MSLFPRRLASIEYVRVDGNGDEEPGQLVYGKVVVTDSGGHNIVYYRPWVNPESKGPGECLSLTGPPRVIAAYDWFMICVSLRVKSGDGGTREIVNGEILWEPFAGYSSIGKRLRKKVRGEHGSATVGFSIIQDAVSAAVEVVMMNELPAQIYGTIKAVRFLGSSGESSSTLILFDKPENEWVQVNPLQSIPLTRPAVFPVPVDSELTILLDLWNHANDHIADGNVKFTPSGQNKIFTVKLGQVQVSITCN